MEEARLKKIEETCEGISITLEWIKTNMEEIHEVLVEQKRKPRIPITSKSREGVQRKHKSPKSKYFQTSDCIHKDILQEHFQFIVETLNFSNTFILDRLVEKKAISHLDNENILNIGPSRKNQNRYLVKKLRNYSEDNFKIFLETIQFDHQDLANKLKSHFERKMRDGNQNKQLCARCMLIRRVDLGDVIDPLFEKGLIDDSVINNYVSRKPSASLLWNQLFHQLKISRPQEKTTSLLSMYLKDKHGDIAELLEKIDVQELNTCSCHRQSNILFKKTKVAQHLQSDGSGSISDISSLDQHEQFNWDSFDSTERQCLKSEDASNKVNTGQKPKIKSIPEHLHLESSSDTFNANEPKQENTDFILKKSQILHSSVNSKGNEPSNQIAMQLTQCDMTQNFAKIEETFGYNYQSITTDESDYEENAVASRQNMPENRSDESSGISTFIRSKTWPQRMHQRKHRGTRKKRRDESGVPIPFKANTDTLDDEFDDPLGETENLDMIQICVPSDKIPKSTSSFTDQYKEDKCGKKSRYPDLEPGRNASSNRTGLESKRSVASSKSTTPTLRANDVDGNVHNNYSPMPNSTRRILSKKQKPEDRFETDSDVFDSVSQYTKQPISKTYNSSVQSRLISSNLHEAYQMQNLHSYYHAASKN